MKEGRNKERIEEQDTKITAKGFNFEKKKLLLSCERGKNLAIEKRNFSITTY